MRAAAAAALVFGLASAWMFAGLWQRGAQREVVISTPAQPERLSTGLRSVLRADVTYEVWLVSRNARALATRPQRLFDAEHCAPAEHSLAYGIPMITMGALAIPVWYATGDPVLTYNATLLVVTLLAAFAMYLLVSAWTGVPAAGVVAGLLFAFHPVRMGAIVYPSVWDASWTVFGIWLAERLSARGRWRDAIGLAAVVALQVGASFYPLLAAVFGVWPLAIWLLLRDRLRGVGPAKLLLLLVAVGLVCAAWLGPYLQVETDAGPLRRQAYVFAPLAGYLPGQPFFAGWALLALVAAALLGGRSGSPGIRGDPRPALVIGMVAVAAVAAGPSLPHPAGTSFDLYRFFAGFLPGLDAVRGVDRLCQGVLLLASVLAGLGAAQLVRRSGRLAAGVGVALVLVAALDVLPLPELGLSRGYRWRYETLEPDPEALAFFRELERLGNAGPLLELPVYTGSRRLVNDPERILLSTWHRRRTSACFGSYLPAGYQHLVELAERLPEPAAIEALAAQGFTTLVLDPRRQPDNPARLSARRIARAARKRRGVELLYETPQRAAYLLRPGTTPSDRRGRR